jgi:hypothetical protein
VDEAVEVDASVAAIADVSEVIREGDELFSDEAALLSRTVAVVSVFSSDFGDVSTFGVSADLIVVKDTLSFGSFWEIIYWDWSFLSGHTSDKDTAEVKLVVLKEVSLICVDARVENFDFLALQRCLPQHLIIAFLMLA